MRMSLNIEQLDLLDDVLAYYVLAGMGGGDRDTPEDHAMMDSLQTRIAEAREREDEKAERDAERGDDLKLSDVEDQY